MDGFRRVGKFQGALDYLTFLGFVRQTKAGEVSPLAFALASLVVVIDPG